MSVNGADHEDLDSVRHVRIEIEGSANIRLVLTLLATLFGDTHIDGFNWCFLIDNFTILEKILVFLSCPAVRRPWSGGRPGTSESRPRGPVSASRINHHLNSSEGSPDEDTTCSRSIYTYCLPGVFSFRWNGK